MIVNTTPSTASNAITLNMAQTNSNGCGSTKGPQWDYASPTPDMEAKGLTPSKMREIVQQINNDSDETMAQHYDPNTTKLLFLPLIPCILLLMGIIINITSIASIASSSSSSGLGMFGIGMVLSMIGGFGSVCCCAGSCFFVSSRYNKAHQICVDQMKQFVEGELNEQWQKGNGIRWSIGTTQVVTTHGTGSDRRLHTRTLYHIQVTSVNPSVAMTQQVPMQHMVQMPLMQGVPVNVQGQQMMMVPAGTQIPMQQVPVQYVAAGSQGAPPQYQSPVPPQYEAGGAVTGTANAEGVHGVYK